MSDSLLPPLVDDLGQPSMLGELLIKWHAALPSDRGGRATLRRATALDEAFNAATFLRLCGQAATRCVGADIERLADLLAPIALVIAEIDRADSRTPGAAFAKPLGHGKAISEQRLRLLAGSDDLALFLRLLRSAIAQTGRSQSVLQTAELVHRWQSPAHIRERARRRLLLDYIQASA